MHILNTRIAEERTFRRHEYVRQSEDKKTRVFRYRFNETYIYMYIYSYSVARRSAKRGFFCACVRLYCLHQRLVDTHATWFLLIRTSYT